MWYCTKNVNSIVTRGSVGMLRTKPLSFHAACNLLALHHSQFEISYQQKRPWSNSLTSRVHICDDRWQGDQYKAAAGHTLLKNSHTTPRMWPMLSFYCTAWSYCTGDFKYKVCYGAWWEVWIGWIGSKWILISSVNWTKIQTPWSLISMKSSPINQYWF